MKIKKGDKVIITKGKDKGKTGTVEKSQPKFQLVTISNVNIYKKSLKKSQKNPQGGIISINMPLHIGNVRLICPRCEKPTKISYKITTNNKLRICKKCQESIDTK